IIVNCLTCTDCHDSRFLLLYMGHQLPRSTLFPYTTLFRSVSACVGQERVARSELSAPLSASSSAHHRAHAASVVAAPRTHSERRSEEHTSELQSRFDLVCRLLLEK